MERYSILHLEDELQLGRFLQIVLPPKGIDYLQVGTLQELGIYLDQRQADLYLLDGNFPLEKDAAPVFAVELAIRMIMEKDCLARILIFSGDRKAKDVAKRYKVRFLDKLADAGRLEDVLYRAVNF